MVIEIESGKYLHTAYAISDVADELLPDEWSTTERADGMDYIGTYTDNDPTDSSDPTDYEWEELFDLDVNDTDSDDEMPVAEEQSQIASVEERLNILEQDSENLNGAIDNLNTNVESASNTSSSAYDIAQATGQHFWSDDNGVHISNEEGNAEGERNSLWNSLGMLFRKGANYLLAILVGGADGTREKGVAIYDGQGNTDSNIVAKFTNEGSVIGNTSKTIIGNNRIVMLNDEGVNLFEASGSGQSLTQRITEYIGLMLYNTQEFEFTIFSNGMPPQNTEFTLEYDYQGSQTKVHSFIVGLYEEWDFTSTDNSTIDIEYDGQQTISGTYTAGTPYSLGEIVTISYTLTSDAPSFTLGNRTQDNVKGAYSLAVGNGIIASENYQTVLGKFNKAKANTKFIIGNGTDENNRENIVEIDNDGNITAKNHVVGIVETGTTSNNWDYRLWSDGTYEAWRSHGFTGMALTSSSAGTYYGNGTTLGVPLFPNNSNTGVIQCLCTANNAFSHSSGVYLYQVVHNATTATADMTFQFRAHASTQSASCGIDIYLKGTYS